MIGSLRWNKSSKRPIYDAGVSPAKIMANTAKPLKPSTVLGIYYLTTFIVGVGLAFPVARCVAIGEIGARGSAILTLCWNVLFVMLLPMVLDWAERRYFKARFVALEDIAKTNPELALMIGEHCKKLSLPGLRLAVVDTTSEELFSYGLWRTNPRLIIPDALLNQPEKGQAIPSIEAELSRFANQDHTLVFLIFTVIQCIVQQLLLAAKLFG